MANREISRQLQGIKSLGAVFRYADCHDACRLLPLGLIVRAFLTTTLVHCRFFGEARFKATIKRKRFSKQNAELTLCFWHRRQGFQIPVVALAKKSMRGHTAH